MAYANNRKAKRKEVRAGGMIYSEAGQRLAECELRNVSATGAQLELRRETNLPVNFILTLSQSGVVRRRCELVWQFSTVLGVRFLSGE